MTKRCIFNKNNKKQEKNIYIMLKTQYNNLTKEINA